MENLQIRAIDQEDAKDIQRIRSLISKEDVDFDFKIIINEQAGGLNKQASIVAEIDNKIVGYMISNVLYAGFGLEKSAWIVDMGVDPDFMGRNIGKKLANKILSIYKSQNITYVFSSVMWDSIDLLSFFKTLGFERSEFINLRKKL
ncbi:MAG: GNAT family N-acetyltransferase [Desulfobacteraceae bacterium]|nr:GNAT family N-acetyltransferase [Desulfobacteraceae bacterium]